MKVLSKEVFVPHRNGIAAFPGFVSYISPEKPILIQRYGWELESDNRDDYVDIYSYDNGRTWTKPEIVKKSVAVPGGRIKYMEFAAYFDADTRQLVTLATKGFYPNDELDVDQTYRMEIVSYDTVRGTWGEPFDTTFGYKEGVAVSFTFPLKTSQGRLLFPACKQRIGPDGKPVHHGGCWAPVDESIVVIGEYAADGTLSWTTSRPVTIDPAKSGRGTDENTIIELPGGKLAMVIRGSNDGLPESAPGYKWCSFSTDGGFTWSEPAPWSYTDGAPVESSATGSCLFRSFTNGKVYWMGNLCRDGAKARGNWPRSPLFIGEVEESSFRLKAETLAVIDERQPGESPGCQLSNFRYYQDRETGEIVLFLTRFGEESEQDWKRAGYYRYRVRID